VGVEQDVPVTGGAVRGLRVAAGERLRERDLRGSLDVPRPRRRPLQPAGWKDTFVAELGPGGAYVWAKSFPGFGVSELAMGGGDDLFLMGMTVGLRTSEGARSARIALPTASMCSFIFYPYRDTR
jgi:hypothetical protein